MAGQYASGTSVSPEKSRNEIERMLERYGATGFLYGRDDERGMALIMFKAHDRQIRFVLPLPDPTDRKFTRTPTGLARSTAGANTAYQQEVRRRWRALLLCIKAKLEIVESGILSFEQEFGVHVVLPNGSTVGEWIEPQIAEAYATGRMPEMLPGAERLAITQNPDQ